MVNMHTLLFQTPPDFFSIIVFAGPGGDIAANVQLATGLTSSHDMLEQSGIVGKGFRPGRNRAV
jgi:hypothetical protein